MIKNMTREAIQKAFIKHNDSIIRIARLRARRDLLSVELTKLCVQVRDDRRRRKNNGLSF